MTNYCFAQLGNKSYLVQFTTRYTQIYIKILFFCIISKKEMEKYIFENLNENFYIKHVFKITIHTMKGKNNVTYSCSDMIN